MAKKQRVIDLTGGLIHQSLRTIAAEASPNQRTRDTRREALHRDFGLCPHGGPESECHGRDSHYGDDG